MLELEKKMQEELFDEVFTLIVKILLEDNMHLTSLVSFEFVKLLLYSKLYFLKRTQHKTCWYCSPKSQSH